MEKILKVLTVESKDIRKAEWGNKEVNYYFEIGVEICFYDEKEHTRSIDPARRGGSNAPFPKRYCYLADLFSCHQVCPITKSFLLLTGNYTLFV